MGKTAVLKIKFTQGQISITLHSNKNWEVSSDPKGLLHSVERGEWRFVPTEGTELIANSQNQITLVGWQMFSNVNNGDAYLPQATVNDIGTFEVTYIQQ